MWEGDRCIFLDGIFFSKNSPDGNRVSLSLRNSFQKPEREVSLEDWFDLYTAIKEKGKEVVVIPDHDDYFGPKNIYSSIGLLTN